MLIDGGIRYKLPINAVAISTAADVFFIAAATTAGARSMVGILGFDLGQDASETSEQLPIQLFRTATDGSALGSAITPSLALPGDPAARFTARAGSMTANAVTALHARITGNALSGWVWTAKDAKDILWIVGDTNTPANARAAIGFPTAPGASMNVSGYVDVIELRW